MENRNQIEKKRMVIRETPDLSIFIDTVEGEQVFVKEAKTENGVSMNEREFYNQTFLRSLSQEKDTGFEFLPPVLDGKKLIYPDISDAVDWLAKDEAPETEMAPLQVYLPVMVKFMRACLEVEFSQLPPEMRLDSEKREATVQGKLEQDAKYLLEKGLLNETDLQEIVEMVRAGLVNKAFHHHDLVPWHMARKHSDGNLILVDSGWSGWSLKYYDIAYYALQMTGYAERKEEARTFLSAIREEFKDDQNFRETLAAPLSYRGIRLAAELDKQGKTKNAQEVLLVVFSEI